jgi:hypothetical protein
MTSFVKALSLSLSLSLSFSYDIEVNVCDVCNACKYAKGQVACPLAQYFSKDLLHVNPLLIIT